jgi:hypothetical protein
MQFPRWNLGLSLIFFNPELIEGWTSGKMGGAEVGNFAGEIYTFANPRFIESCSHE